MKRLSVIITLVTLMIIFTSAVEKVQKSAGPPSCSAGEPPNNTNCTNCHNDGVVNTGTANVTFDLGGADTAYMPGRTYTITVAVSKAGMRRAGFQCIALRDNDDKTSPGTVTLTDVARTQVLDKNAPHSGGCLDEERVWIEHTYAGNSSNDSGISRWSYQWQAPSTAAGSITFYLAALESNNDLAETGDQVYTMKKTIAGLPVGLNETNIAHSFVLYPLPASTELIIKTGKQILDQIKLYNSTGKQVKAWDKNSMHAQHETVKLSTRDIPSGIYFLNIEGNFGSVVQKVFIHQP
ncbi:MAG: choice-of-anchor V domain-containing protein [Bacteroidota bacterium]